jgi:hypothetical protein
MKVLSVIVVFASALAVAVGLRLSDSQQSWLLLGLVIVVAMTAIVRLNVAARQAVMLATTSLLFVPLQGWANTLSATKSSSFVTYPHAYVAAAVAALLCFAVGDVHRIASLRPATAVMIATAIALVQPAGRTRDVVVVFIFVATVPLLAYLLEAKSLSVLVRAAYAVVEPMIIGVLMWLTLPLDDGSFGFGLLEFEAITALPPTVVILIVFLAAKAANGYGSAVTDRLSDDQTLPTS